MKKWGGLLIIIAAAIMLELISAIQYYQMHDMLEAQLQGRAQTEMTLKASIAKRTIDNTERSLKSHIREIKYALDNPDSLSNFLTWIIKYHPAMRGAGIAFKPNYYPQKGRLFEPYALRTDSGDIRTLQIAGPDFDYTRDGFYRDVMEKHDGGWVGPYEDKFLHERLVTYAVPIYTKDTGDTVAVFGIDISASLMADTLNKHHLYPSSFNVLLTKDGELIAGPSDPAMRKKVEQVVSIINDSTVPKMVSQNGHGLIAEYHDVNDGAKAYVFFANFRGQPHWQIATVYYDDEVYGALRKLRLSTLLMMVVAMAVLGFIIWRFAGNSQKLRKSMVKQERIDNELKIARNIQAEMLPQTWPPFPDRNDLNIYGSLIAAREVGGDLFDFFIRDEKLFFCIGDVSGKGIPAAMVMAVTHSLFRSASSHENNPGRILHNINETLCLNNKSNMFVTLFIGVLNLPTGRLRYCNAGHDKPFVLQLPGHDGDERQHHALAANANLPLGVFADTRYEPQEYMLPPGALLFLYTDGLTEARSASHQMFGLPRVDSLLATLPLNPPTTDTTARQPLSLQLTLAMQQAVKDFADGAEQADDLTMLAINYTPQHTDHLVKEEITVSNDIHAITEVNQFVKSVLTRHAIEPKLARRLQLAIEEAVVNVMNYAYPGGIEGKVTLSILTGEQKVQFVITDTGIPFDPTESVKPDITLIAEDRPIGGLGILLVRELMDAINYERTNGQNILTLTKHINV